MELESKEDELEIDDLNDLQTASHVYGLSEMCHREREQQLERVQEQL